MKTIKDMKVGDTVWYTDANRRDKLFTTIVTKVGTKLVHTKLGVFRIEDMRTNDDYQHQRFYLEEEAFERETERKKMMSQIRCAALTDVSYENLKKIVELLDNKGETK